jgi:hypothetical protein
MGDSTLVETLNIWRVVISEFVLPKSAPALQELLARNEPVGHRTHYTIDLGDPGIAVLYYHIAPTVPSAKILFDQVIDPRATLRSQLPLLAQIQSGDHFPNTQVLNLIMEATNNNDDD